MRNLEIVNYQRNGISGEGFYTACFEDDGKRLMATFAVNDETEMAIVSSCRVNDRDDLRTNWRGDYYAEAINDELKRYGATVRSACQSWGHFVEAA